MSSTPFRTDELEAVAYDFWRAPEVAEVDGWRLRFAHGVTGRANSVWPNGPGGLPLDEKIDRAEEWYRARGVPVASFQLTEAAQPAGLGGGAGRARLREPARRPRLQVASLGEVIERTLGEASVTREVDDAWIELWAGTRGFKNHEVARAILTDGDTAFARVDDVAVGRRGRRGRVARDHFDGDAPRGAAPGTRTERSCTRLRAGPRDAAAHAVVQVDAHERAALTLYPDVGFIGNHTYHYRILR